MSAAATGRREEVVQQLDPTADAPRAARAVAAEVMGRFGVTGERADDVALLVSELVANAAVHAPPGAIELHVVATNALIRIEVHDAGTQAFAWPLRDGVRRHGLELVASFSDRNGIDRTPATVAWCEFDLDRPAERPQAAGR